MSCKVVEARSASFVARPHGVQGAGKVTCSAAGIDPLPDEGNRSGVAQRALQLQHQAVHRAAMAVVNEEHGGHLVAVGCMRESLASNSPSRECA